MTTISSLSLKFALADQIPFPERSQGVSSFQYIQIKTELSKIKKQLYFNDYDYTPNWVFVN